MSARDGAITTRNPASSSAHTACSRLDPVPKFGPATRIEAPAWSGRFRTKAGSLRHSANRNGAKPVRSIRFRNSAGMIWSVSTSERSMGSTVPVWVVKGRIPLPSVRYSSLDAQVGRGAEVAGDGGGRGDGGADQMGPATLALAALEVPVRCRGAPFAGGELIRVHPQAHRAPGIAPVEPCCA